MAATPDLVDQILDSPSPAASAPAGDIVDQVLGPPDIVDSILDGAPSFKSADVSLSPIPDPTRTVNPAYAANPLNQITANGRPAWQNALQVQFNTHPELTDKGRQALTLKMMDAAGLTPTVEQYNQTPVSGVKGAYEAGMNVLNAGMGGLVDTGTSLLGTVAPQTANRVQQKFQEQAPHPQNLGYQVPRALTGAATQFALAAPAVAAKALPATLGALGGAMGAGQARMEVDQARQRGAEVSAGQEAGAALGYGLLNAGAGYLGGKVFADIAPRVAASRPTILGRAGTALGVDTGINAATEGATALGENITAQQAFDPNRPTMQGVAERTMLGGVAALPFAPLSVGQANRLNLNKVVEQVFGKTAKPSARPAGQAAAAAEVLASRSTDKGVAWYLDPAGPDGVYHQPTNTILLNAAKPDQALRFAAAHEVGHAMRKQAPTRARNVIEGNDPALQQQGDPSLIQQGARVQENAVLDVGEQAVTNGPQPALPRDRMEAEAQKVIPLLNRLREDGAQLDPETHAKLSEQVAQIDPGIRRLAIARIEAQRMQNPGVRADEGFATVAEHALSDPGYQRGLIEGDTFAARVRDTLGKIIAEVKGKSAVRGRLLERNAALIDDLAKYMEPGRRRLSNAEEGQQAGINRRIDRAEDARLVQEENDLLAQRQAREAEDAQEATLEEQARESLGMRQAEEYNAARQGMLETQQLNDAIQQENAEEARAFGEIRQRNKVQAELAEALGEADTYGPRRQEAVDQVRTMLALDNLDDLARESAWKMRAGRSRREASNAAPAGVGYRVFQGNLEPKALVTPERVPEMLANAAPDHPAHLAQAMAEAVARNPRNAPVHRVNANQLPDGSTVEVSPDFAVTVNHSTGTLDASDGRSFPIPEDGMDLFGRVKPAEAPADTPNRPEQQGGGKTGRKYPKEAAAHHESIPDDVAPFSVRPDQPIDPDNLPKATLARMSQRLKAKGYNVRGTEDVRDLMKQGRVFRDGKFTQPDWQEAYDAAVGANEKAKATRQAKSDERAQYPNVNWQRLQELGYTNDLREAGYIAPDGKLIDLSGKREGGQPGTRSYDHREAGGTGGMQEAKAAGYVRYFPESGGFDIAKAPAPQQLRQIIRAIDFHKGEITLDLQDGLGEYKANDQYYQQPRRTWHAEYPEGTSPSKIVGDIRRFFSGQEMPDSGTRFSLRPNHSAAYAENPGPNELRRLLKESDHGEVRILLRGDKYFAWDAQEANHTEFAKAALGEKEEPAWPDRLVLYRRNVAVPAESMDHPLVQKLRQAGYEVVEREPSTGGVKFAVRPDPTRGQNYELTNESTWEAIRANVQDAFRPLQRNIRDVVRQGGRLADDSDPYLRQKLFQGRVAERVRQVEDAYVNPIVEEMTKARLTTDDVDEYLYALHAPERNAQVATINPNLPDGGSGMTDADAAAAVAKWQADPRFGAMQSIAAKVRQMNDRTLTLMESAGLIEPSAAAAMRQQYQHYVPLRTDMEAEGVNLSRGQGYTVKGKDAKRALGRATRADSPLTFSLMQAQEKIVRAEKNRVGQALLKFVRDNPDPGLWEIHTNLPTKQGLVNGQVQQVPDPLFQTAEHVVSIKENGKPVLIEFKGDAGRELARTIKRLGEEHAGPILRALNKGMRLFKAAATSYNPEFLIPNLVRDAQTAALNLSAEESRKMAGRVIRNIPKAARAVWDVTGDRTRGRGKEYHDYTREYLKAGGKVDTFALGDFEATSKQIATLLKDANPTKARRVLLAAKKAGAVIERFNGAAENAVRLSAYVEARKAGASVERAAYLAKNLTLDFNTHGRYGPVINALYAFSNASIQGTARTIQAMATTPTGRKIALGILGSGFAYALIAPQLFGEDDSGRNRYDTIPDGIKQTSIVLPNPLSKGGYIKLPMPYGYNAIFSAGRLIGESVTGRTKPADAAARLASTATNAFNPLGSDGSFLQTLAPTALDPFVQASENKDFAGREIVPAQSPFGPPAPDSQLARRDTSPVTASIMQWLNRVTGGDEVTPGMIDVSPATVDHFVGWAFGGIGRFAGTVMDTPGRLARGELSPGTVPVVRRFAGDEPKGTDAREFYATLDEARTAQHRLEHYEATGNTQAAQRLRQEQGRALEFIRYGEDVRRRVAEIRRRAEAAEDPQAKKEAETELRQLLSSYNRDYKAGNLPVEWQFENQYALLNDRRQSRTRALRLVKEASDLREAGKLTLANQRRTEALELLRSSVLSGRDRAKLARMGRIKRRLDLLQRRRGLLSPEAYDRAVRRLLA